MEKRFLTLIFGFLFLIMGMNRLYAQNDFMMRGEGNDKTVKLMWLPESWPSDMIGFHVKRRAINNGQAGVWTQLNGQVIIPESAVAKELTNVEPSPDERARLQRKLQQSVQQGKAFEVQNARYLTALTNDQNTLRSLGLVFSLDYDLAVWNGFGLIDRNISPADRYEYGLFPVYRDRESQQPAATYEWEYGTTPDLSLEMTSEVVVSGRNKGVRVRWELSSEEYNGKQFSGFDIYRKEAGGEPEKLNENRIKINTSKEQAEVFINDTNIEEDKAYSYSAVPVSLFGTPGEAVAVTFDPAQLPLDVKAPILGYETGKREDLEITFNWSVAPEDMRFIEGFYIEEKHHRDSLYKHVTQQLPPATNTVKVLPLETGYVFFRLIAVLNNGQQLPSNEQLMYYEPVIKPAQPEGLTGEWIPDEKVIRLKWSDNSSAPTKGYYIYSAFPGSRTSARNADLPIITATEFDFKPLLLKSGAYRIKVVAVSEQGEESDPSEEITVIVPTQRLPFIRIWPVSVENDKVVLNWKYPENIPDLAGFRIFRDGELIADEQTVGQSLRSWTSQAMEAGKYQFTIQAVTQSGVESKVSLSRVITVKGN